MEAPNAAPGFEFDSRYAEAFFSVPHRCLGRALKPFSVWHKTMLEYADSPVLLGTVPSMAQLDYAVRVCVTGFPQLPDIPGAGFLARLWRAWRFSRFNKEREIRAFYDYLDDYYSPPDIQRAPSKVQGETIPDMDDAIGAVAAYRGMTKCPRAEAWDLPYGELLWMNAALSRREGADFRILTPQAAERLRELKEQREKERMEKESQPEPDNAASN